MSEGQVKLDSAGVASAAPAPAAPGKPTKVRGTRVTNPELVAMQRITNILQGLEPATRANVLDFINRTFQPSRS